MTVVPPDKVVLFRCRCSEIISLHLPYAAFEKSAALYALAQVQPCKHTLRTRTCMSVRDRAHTKKVLDGSRFADRGDSHNRRAPWQGLSL